VAIMKELKGLWPLVGGIVIFVLIGFLYTMILYFSK